MSELVYTTTSKFKYSKKDLVEAIFLNIDSIPSNFFPSFTSSYTRAAYILNKYRITDFASAQSYGEDLKILWLLTYINQDRVGIASAAQLFYGAVNAIKAEYETLQEKGTSDPPTIYNYIDGGIDLFKVLNNASIVNLSPLLFRPGTADPWVPFTLAAYFRYGFGIDATADPLNATTVFTAEASIAGSNGNPVVVIPFSGLEDEFQKNLRLLATGTFLQNYDDTVDYYASLITSTADTGLQVSLDLTADTVEIVTESIATNFLTLLNAINSPNTLNRVLWLYIAAILFGWKPIEEWFVDYNVWQEIPTTYRGPVPAFNEYITNVFQGSPYRGVSAQRGKTVGRGSVPTRGHGRGRGKK